MNILYLLLNLLDNPSRELRIKFDKDNRCLRFQLDEKVKDDTLTAKMAVGVRELELGYHSIIYDILENTANIIDGRIGMEKDRRCPSK